MFPFSFKLECFDDKLQHCTMYILLCCCKYQITKIISVLVGICSVSDIRLHARKLGNFIENIKSPS